MSTSSLSGTVAGIPAISVETILINGSATISKQATPLVTPAEVAIDIPSFPSKKSIPPTCIFLKSDGGWKFIDITVTPAKELSTTVPAVRSYSKVLACPVLAITLLLLIGFLSWYIFTITVYTINDPKFQIDSAWVETTVVHEPGDNYIKADWKVDIMAMNPNEHTPIVYKRISAGMSRNFDGFEVSDVIAAPFGQEPGNSTALVVRSEPESKGTKLRYEILDTVLQFNVTIQVELSYQCRTCFREQSFELEIFCPDVMVLHQAGKGGYFGGTQDCSVQKKKKI